MDEQNELSEQTTLISNIKLLESVEGLEESSKPFVASLPSQLFRILPGRSLRRIQGRIRSECHQSRPASVLGG